uniref:Uncharacterized protein n=1 Tax=Siphoviridae sp. ctJhT5 TaxID=2826242 RepID=A0A8S5QYW9_9CAUD|nr:MAG TPA: hypothetical protein [Siphoviridae sp. ctJhT5]
MGFRMQQTPSTALVGCGGFIFIFSSFQTPS